MEYIYIAKLNPWNRYQIMGFILLFFIFSFNFSFLINKYIPILIIGITLCAIVLVLKYLNLEDNAIKLYSDKLMHLKGKKCTTYTYDSIIKIVIEKPFGNRNHVTVKLVGKSFIVDIERKDGKDVDLIDFIGFMFSKNENIEILEKCNFEKFKYFKLRGQVRKVLMK